MIKANKDNIVIKLLEKEPDIKIGGIYLPQTNSNKHLTQLIGVVQALGTYNNEPDREVPFSVKLGDTVVLEKTAGIPYQDGEDSYLVIKESDILLILNKK